LIPQQPFLEACVQYDVCFADGRPLSICNTEFLENMLQIVEVNRVAIENAGGDLLIAAISTSVQKQLAKLSKLLLIGKELISTVRMV
jgi:hypothetical protein